MKSVALIGVSGYARKHLFMAIEQMVQGRCRLVAATVPNREQERVFCERLESLGCAIYQSTAAMWRAHKGRVDLCLIPTGLHLHAAMVLEALRAGAHVLVEKPLATRLSDTAAIRRLEIATGRSVSVGFQDFYAQTTWDLKGQLLAGTIGEVRRISFVGLWSRPQSYYTRNQWAGRLRLGRLAVLDSPISNAFAHFANLALFWAGSAVEDSARVLSVEAELYRTRQIESFDTCCFRAALSTGITADFYVTHSCAVETRPVVRIFGTEGSIEWVQESHVELHRDGRPTTRTPIPGKWETKLMMGDAVLARCEGRPARVCTTAVATEHVRLVQALHSPGLSIRTVPKRFLRLTEREKGDPVPALAGIEEASERGASTRRLWSELKLPWARRRAGTVRLVGG